MLPKIPGVTRCVVLVLMVLPAFAAQHHGQVLFGGLPVPGASITATLGDRTFATVSDQQGAYAFPDLPDGTWKFHIEMLGFAPLDGEAAVMPNAPDARWDLHMLPLSEMKAVAAPQVATAQPAPAADAKPRPAARKGKGGPPAPTNTQTPFQRAEVTAASGGAPPAEPADQNTGELSQQASDGFLINGTANNGAASTFATSPAFGNNRRGPRSLYSGNLGFTLDNSALDARPFSLTGQDTPRAAYNRFTGLASFGGPLKIPHLIRNGPTVFVNYQWTRNRNASTQPALMPTDAERNGDLSRVTTPQGQPVSILDPSTGHPFPGNAIPPSLISPQAKALLNLYPLPNFDGGARYNYQAPLVGILHQDALQSRVNETINRHNQLFGFFAMQSMRTDTPNLFGFLDTGSTLGLTAGAYWRHSFKPRLYGTFGYLFSRYAARTKPYFAYRQNIAGAAGISGDNQDPVNWGPPRLSFASGIEPLSDGSPSFTRSQTTAVSYETVWNRGSHNLTIGGDLRRQTFNLLFQQDPRGTFGFTGAATGNDFAGFLLGIPDTSSIAFGNADKYFRAWGYDAYFNDDWRISPSFTLNAGARWEYWSPITERYGRLVNLDIAPGFGADAPVEANHPTGALTGQAYPASLVRPDKHAIQPRVAFSWRPIAASSMVVRGGYGVYYNTSVYLPIALQMAQQPPLSKNLSISNSPAHPLTLANGFPDAAAANTFAVDPGFRIGYSQNWQVSVQRDLPGSLVATGVYMGNKGTRGMQEFLPNTFPAGAANPCPACPSGFIYLTSNGNSNRHAGQIQLRRRLHSGISAELRYTYSKSIDDATLGGRNQSVTPTTGPGAAFAYSAQSPGASQSAPLIAQNWLDLSAERGLSNFDQRHVASVQFQYTTGMGIAGGTLVRGWKGALFKEWTLVNQITAGTGLPLTPVYVTAVAGTGVTGSVRPDYTGAPLYSAPPGAYLNSGAYAAPAAGHWGNAGRNSITGPSQFTCNASLGRTFRVSDRLSLDGRIDLANALNHVTFPSWNTTANSAQFGLPGAANPMRSVQTTVRLRF